MDSCRIALIGATGAVGSVFLNILEERHFPASEIRLCASKRSVGKKLKVMGREIAVEEVTPRLLSEVDIVFIAAGANVSLEVAPLAVEQGAFVVDKSSAFRMYPGVPLVVPEVNGDDIADHKGIVSVPNCSTTPLVMVLKPLRELSPVRRVVVDTYQSVSGSGAEAVEELRVQSGRLMAEWDKTPDDPPLVNGDTRGVRHDAYPHPIAFNTLPHIEEFWDNGYTNEEMKMLNETRKILHDDQIAVSATCVRVPVMVSHSEAVHIEFERPVSPDEVREALSSFPGVCVVDEPKSNVYPMPVDAAGKDEVFVGRIRRDMSHPNGIAMWLVSDNLRKGAATNALQIAEEALRRDLVPGRKGSAVG